MQRLTKYISGYAHGKMFREDGYARGEADMIECIDRLAEYEDTGLTPEEIESLKAENEQLKSQLAEAMELLKLSANFANSYSGWWRFQNCQDRYEKLKSEVKKK